MKAIFVDIDGVLNNEIMYKEGTKSEFLNEVYPICLIDSHCAKRLSDVFKKTNAKFILSSSWRFEEKELLVFLFTFIGLPTNFDVTPDFLFRGIEYVRGDEIKEYLEKHPEIDNYCIIDDDNDMLEEQKEHFVKINEYYGLTDVDCEKIKKILKI